MQMLSITKYRHDKMLDLDIIVLEPSVLVDTGILVKVLYWNRHYNVFQGRAENIIIRFSDLKNWKLVIDPVLESIE